MEHRFVEGRRNYCGPTQRLKLAGKLVQQYGTNGSITGVARPRHPRLRTEDVRKPPGSGRNGREHSQRAVGVKLFPRHLIEVQDNYGREFLVEFQKRHEMGLVRLKRRDRLRQAISLARARTTRKWTKKSSSAYDTVERYDFSRIRGAYICIEHAEAFWDSYFRLRNLRPDCFIYEDVLTQPDRFVGAVARHLDVETTHDLATDFEVQRDSITDEWLDRFQADVSQKGFSFQSERPARTVKNLVRFLRKMPMKI